MLGDVYFVERNTQQRRAILKVFEKTTRPLSVQEVLDLAKRKSPGIGIATIYRNLKSLQEEGLLQLVELPGGSSVYELPSLDHHHHFSCTKCLKVFDIDACQVNFQALVPAGFQLQQHEILLSGLCDKCLQKSS